MTPTEIETAARRKYNAVGDTFFAQAEILDLLYEACQVMATEAQVIERTYTTSSVSSQQEYSYPSYLIAPKRVLYNGQKLKPITFREDDAITLLNASVATTGTPQYYAIWNETLILRPIPDTSSITITVYGYAEPQTITTSSTLEIPTMWHMGLVNYIVSQMFAKDQNIPMMTKYEDLWEKALNRAKRWQQKKKRADGFNVVQDEESLAETILGSV